MANYEVHYKRDIKFIPTSVSLEWGYITCYNKFPLMCDVIRVDNGRNKLYNLGGEYTVGPNIVHWILDQNITCRRNQIWDYSLPAVGTPMLISDVRMATK